MMNSPAASRILFVDLANRPGSDRTVAGMARLGAACAVLTSRKSFAARSRHTAKTVALPAFGSRWIPRLLLRARLRKAIRDWRPDILIPLDEQADRALRDLRLSAHATPALRALIDMSLGSADHADVFGDRDRLLSLARDLGLPLASKAAAPTKTSAQTLVRMVACVEGRVLDGASFRISQVDPSSGAGTVLHPIERPDMDAATRTLVAALGCTGFVSLRFTREGEAAGLCSIHPGAPIGGHIGRLFGHDIHEALLDHLGGRPAPQPRALAEGPATIALFPNELDRDPASRALNVPYALHDMPWDDLGMMDIYARWLRRRHPGAARQLRRHLPGEGMPTAIDLRSLVASLDRYP